MHYNLGQLFSLKWRVVFSDAEDPYQIMSDSAAVRSSVEAVKSIPTILVRYHNRIQYPFVSVGSLEDLSRLPHRQGTHVYDTPIVRRLIYPTHTLVVNPQADLAIELHFRKDLLNLPEAVYSGKILAGEPLIYLPYVSALIKLGVNVMEHFGDLLVLEDSNKVVASVMNAKENTISVSSLIPFNDIDYHLHERLYGLNSNVEKSRLRKVRPIKSYLKNGTTKEDLIETFLGQFNTKESDLTPAEIQSSRDLYKLVSTEDFILKGKRPQKLCYVHWRDLDQRKLTV